jgi:hypothetical protein
VPASHGNPPPASLDPQLAPPTVMMPQEMPKLAVPETVVVAPEVPLPQGGQIGDMMSKSSSFVEWTWGTGRDRERLLRRHRGLNRASRW